MKGLPVLIIMLPSILSAQGASLQVEDVQDYAITISWPAVPQASFYRVYRAPFIGKRRTIKLPMLATIPNDGSPILTFTDYDLFDLRAYGYDHVAYLVTWVSQGAESSYVAAYQNRLILYPPEIKSLSVPEGVCEGTPMPVASQVQGLVSRYAWRSGETVLLEESAGTIQLNQPGPTQLVFEAISPLGNVSEDKLVEVWPLPEPSIQGDSFICEAGTLSVAGEYTSYQWYRDGQLLEDAQGSSLEVEEAGIYTVAVMDEKGCQGLSSGFSVAFYPEPAVSLDATFSEARVGEEVSFYALAEGSSLTYAWEIEGQEEDEIEGGDTLMYTFKKPGSYTVNVKVTDICGRTAQASSDITILPGVFGVFPPSGTSRGGTEVTLDGSAFPSNPEVLVDGVKTDVVSHDSHRLHIIMPPHDSTLAPVSIRVRDKEDGMITHEVLEAYRYIRFGAVLEDETNRIIPLDLDREALYAWPLEEGESPYMPLDGFNVMPGDLRDLKFSQDGRYLYLLGNTGLWKVDMASADVVAEVYAYAGESWQVLGLSQERIYVGYILGEEGGIRVFDQTLSILADSPLEGTALNLLDIAFQGDDLYLWLFGNAQEGNSSGNPPPRLIIMVYKVQLEDEEGEWLTLEALRKLPPLQDGELTHGKLGKAWELGRLYAPVTYQEEVRGFRIGENTFIGPPIETESLKPIFSHVTSWDGSFNLVVAFEGSGILQAYTLPEQGPSGLIWSIDLASYGCPSIADIVGLEKLYIACRGASQLLLIDPATLMIQSVSLPAKPAIQMDLTKEE